MTHSEHRLTKLFPTTVLSLARTSVTTLVDKIIMVGMCCEAGRQRSGPNTRTVGELRPLENLTGWGIVSCASKPGGLRLLHAAPWNRIIPQHGSRMICFAALFGWFICLQYKPQHTRLSNSLNIYMPSQHSWHLECGHYVLVRLEMPHSTWDKGYKDQPIYTPRLEVFRAFNVLRNARRWCL